MRQFRIAVLLAIGLGAWILRGDFVDSSATVEGDVYTITLQARTAAGEKIETAEWPVGLSVLRIGKARAELLDVSTGRPGEASLGPTNEVRLCRGTARVVVRRKICRDNSYLIMKPKDKRLPQTEIQFRSPLERRGVWVRDPNGGVPHEEPAESVTNAVAVEVKTSHAFNWFEDSKEPLSFTSTTENVSDRQQDLAIRAIVRNWDGEAVVEQIASAVLKPGETKDIAVSFHPSEERGIYFVEVSVREKNGGKELAFTRTNIVRLPPYAYQSTATNSIFGISAYWDLPSHEEARRFMDRLGMRWARYGDVRYEHPERKVNWHNNLGNWDNSNWSEKDRDAWIVSQLELCLAQGNEYLEFGNEMNLKGLEIGQTMAGIGRAERAKVYASWVKSFRRVMKEKGYEGKVKLLGFGMAGFDLPFAKVMVEEGAWECLDGFCLHAANSQYTPDYPYGLASVGPIERALGPHPGEHKVPGHYWNFFGTIRTAKDFIAKHGEMPLWMTEVYSSDYPNFKWGASMRDGADNVVLEYALLASENVKAGFWYMYGDGIGRDRFGVNPKDREYSFGLLARDYSFKPVALAYCTIAEALDCATCKGWLKMKDPKTHGLLFETPKGPLAVLWARWDGLYVTTEPPNGVACKHKEAWVDRWPTKKDVVLPASGSVVRTDVIGRRRDVAVSEGQASIRLDGSPCLVYGLDEERLELVK